MKPKESIETRREMAKMHDDVLNRIEIAYNNNRFIEVCWLCYACFESRVNRTLEKICSGCSKNKRTNKRYVGITTKLTCYVRLIKSKYPPLSGENADRINAVKSWCKERNNLIHGMISLEQYNNADKKFKDLAKKGRTLVKQMYSLSTDVRNFYYNTEEIPMFDEHITSQCKLKEKCIIEE